MATLICTPVSLGEGIRFPPSIGIKRQREVIDEPSALWERMGAGAQIRKRTMYMPERPAKQPRHGDAEEDEPSNLWERVSTA